MRILRLQMDVGHEVLSDAHLMLIVRAYFAHEAGPQEGFCSG